MRYAFDNKFFSYLQNLERRWNAKPLNLGGGRLGHGGPPGGFIGYLPQNRVSFDEDEEEIWDLPPSGIYPSGCSLITNLDRIRYRVATIEDAISSGVGGEIDIYENDLLIAAGVTILNFEGDVSVIDDGGDQVTITVTSSGVNNDIKAKISANDNTTNYLEEKLVAGDDILITILNEGGNEQLEINATCSGLDLGWINVEEHGAVHDGITDDTVAIQSAIDAAEIAGGGTIYFPMGTYLVSGALQDVDGANSQLVLPDTASTVGEKITIAFVGEREVAGNFAVSGIDMIERNHGTIIKGALNAGVGGTMIGCAGSDETGFSGMHIVIQNITTRMPDNPVLTAIDLSKVATVKINNLMIDVGTPNVDDVTEPSTSTSYGLKTPDNNNGAHTYIRELAIMGYYNGVSLGEHADVDELVIFGCQNAIEFPASSHPLWIGRINIVDCAYGLVWTGANKLSIEQLAIERYDGAPSKWFDPVYDIYDPNNYGEGTIVYNVIISGAGGDIISYSGGYKINLCHLSSAIRPDGWIYEWETWAYASSTTFTIVGDRTGRYNKGLKLKVQQATGNVKYFYVISSSYGAPNTTVTVDGGTDYTLANEAFTFKHYSRQITPTGFPHWFHVTAPTITYIDNGSGGQPTINEAKFTINGRTVIAHLNGSGTKDITTSSFYFPDTSFPLIARTEYSGRSCVGNCNVYTTAHFVGIVNHNADNNFYAILSATITDNTAITDFSLTLTYEI